MPITPSPDALARLLADLGDGHYLYGADRARIGRATAALAAGELTARTYRTHMPKLWFATATNEEVSGSLAVLVLCGLATVTVELTAEGTRRAAEAGLAVLTSPQPTDRPAG